MTPVTKADLHTYAHVSPRPYLHCQGCNAEYSADPGDYFMLPDTHVFKHCGAYMELYVTVTRILPVDTYLSEPEAP